MTTGRPGCSASRTMLVTAMALLVAGDARHPRAQTPAQAGPVNPLVEQLIAAPSQPARTAILDANGPAITLELQRALSARGVELRRLSRLDEAAGAYLATRLVAERRDDRVALAMSLVGYSAIPGQRADYPAALAALSEALAIGEALKNDDVIASALANLAIIYRLTGEFERSIETNRRALALAIASSDEYTQGRVYSNLGIVYAAQGHYREALDVYEKSVAIKERTSDAGDVGATLNNIGNIHFEQGNLELALGYYTRALAAIAKSTGEPQGRAAELGNIGVVYREMGKLDLALDHFQRALAAHEAVGNRRGIATATYNVASVRRLEGKRDEALAGYRKSLELREPINDRGGIRESLDAIANLLARMSQPAEALAMAERAAAVARDLKSNELLWQPLITVGGILEDTGEPARAEAAYREAIDAIETIRVEVAGGAESRRRYFESKLVAYHRLTGVLLTGNRPGEALAVAERARGRVLAELLEGADVAVRPLTPVERDTQRKLEQDVVADTQRLAAAERRPASEPAGKDVADASDRLRAARVAADAFRDALDARYPVRRLAKVDAQTDPLAAAAALLPDARTALIEFVVADEATYVFALTRSEASAAESALLLSTFTVPIARAALSARVGAYRTKLASRALDFHADARALYDLLLKPAHGVLAGRTHLVIVPDDALWTIPFETLALSRDRALIDEATVTYAPSIAVLRSMHERRAALESAGRQPRLVIAADPASDLPKLPEAQLQAAALTALYGASRSRAFVGAAATEPRVRTAAAGASILHFATHGVVDDTNPMYSFLQLTRTGQIDAENDGRLEAWEILSMKLEATVAVLTACDTARGKGGGGEGVIGLAWAFFAAGTPATVVSLWQLESSSATTLTLGLHQRLQTAMVRGHGSVGDSLRAAALQLRRDPRYRHPFYWAGLVTVGDGY